MRKLLIGVIAGLVIFVTAGAFAYMLLPSNSIRMDSMMESNNVDSMMGGSNMDMMNQEPRDALIKVTSPQVISLGEVSEITFAISDKKTGLPMTNADVLIGIEKGASMTTMQMEGHMSSAIEKSAGTYSFKIKPQTTGIYTLHLHVIPEGKSMHSMMLNHMDVGLIVK